MTAKFEFSVSFGENAQKCHDLLTYLTRYETIAPSVPILGSGIEAANLRRGDVISNQTAVLPRPWNKVDDVAIRALAVLAASNDQHASRKPKPNLHTDPEFVQELVKRLYGASTSSDRHEITGVIKEIQSKHVKIEDIISVLVPKTARRLGQDWVEDTASFGTVTIGCARLQACVHHLERSFAERPLRKTAQSGNFLVAVPEGAQHTLGAVVLAAQLRQAGAVVQLVLDASAEHMSKRVKTEQFQAVLISASMGQNIESLRQFVQASRDRENQSNVIVGGSLLSVQSDLNARVGADAATNKWQEAIKLGLRGLPCRQVAL